MTVEDKKPEGRAYNQLESVRKHEEFIERKKELADKIRQGELNESEAKEAFRNYLYAEAPAVQKTFGKCVEDIMVSQGLTKKWGIDIETGEPKYKLDIPTAVQLTGLNRNVFYNMYKLNAVVDISMVVSMCIGFNLNETFTHELLHSAGLSFRLDNPEHQAYLFLLQYCKDMPIEDCNDILEKIGVPKARRLGSYSKTRKKRTEKDK